MVVAAAVVAVVMAVVVFLMMLIQRCRQRTTRAKDRIKTCTECVQRFVEISSQVRNLSGGVHTSHKPDAPCQEGS